LPTAMHLHNKGELINTLLIHNKHNIIIETNGQDNKLNFIIFIFSKL